MSADPVVELPGPGPLARFDGAGDRWLLLAMNLVVLTRAAPFYIWGWPDCVRDECSYRWLARGLVEGQGLRPMAEGWLWAPGYPALMALMELTVGDLYAVKALQVILSALSTWLIYRIATRVYGRDAGRVAAWAYALHPTLAFYAGRLWSELVYSFLLLAAVLGMLWARDGRWRRAVVPGAFIGVCVLFRGVALLLAPLLALALIWPTAAENVATAVRSRWRHAMTALVAAAICVAPYSVHASLKHGRPIVSDATLGRMMFLGNNEFPPMTFDVGNGVLTGNLYAEVLKRGRPPCDKKLPVLERDRCEVQAGVAWIQANPDRFLRRIPERLAQLLDPHSFLSRHLRQSRWYGVPWGVKEGLALWVVVTSYLVMWAGTVAAFARGRGPFGVFSALVVLYHVAAIALLAGLSRYRLPLEPLWIVHLSVLIARPRETLAALDGPRLAGALLAMPALIGLSLRFLAVGFPGPW